MKLFLRHPLAVATASTCALILTSTAAQAGSDEILVTATRTPVTVNDSLAAVTVLTAADIQRSSARSLPDLLASTPGVISNSAGGVGKLSSLYIRGSNATHTLVLLNGVRVESASAGTAALQDIPLSQIERIEIVRGPRSSLYGAEAVGGVVQIFTKKGGNGMRSEVEIGSQSSAKLTQSYSYDKDGTQLSLTASMQDTQGINAQKDAQPDRDGYRNQSLAVAADHRWNDEWRSGFSFFRAQGRNDYDNSFDPSLTAQYYDNFVQQVSDLHLGYSPSQQLDVRLQLSEQRDDSFNFIDGQDDNSFLSKRYTASLQGDYQLTPEHLLTLGSEYSDDTLNGTTDFTQHSRDNRALFAQWQAQHKRLDWQLSGRVDDNEAFGNHSTWNAAAGYWLMDSLKGFVGYGTAFKAPNFNDLYYPDVGYYRGNPDLRVESSKSWELGLKGHYGRPQQWESHWSLSLFQNQIDDLINYDPVQATVVNIDKARIRGVEAEWAGSWQGWQLQLNSSYMQPKDRGSDLELVRRPRWSGNASLGYGWSQYLATASLRAQGKSYNDASNSTKVGGFGVTDIGLTWTPEQHWSLKGEVTNLFNRDYELLHGYNTEDRSYWMTLAYQP